MAESKAKAVTTLEEFNKIINQDKYTVFDFWATWCAPCRLISPTFEALAKSVAEADESKIEFYKVDTDAAIDIAGQGMGEDEDEKKVDGFPVTIMPTFLMFKNGKVVNEFKGAYRDKLMAMITSVVKIDEERLKGNLQNAKK
ncbi:thioredoxin-like protein [Rickenella mellea]|uniref:Thioredoxin-like protein n=1 Tax=Rickenella mellea TaxID=50990 RepID=A0A4Y7Q110_9AGAM|nr:thioredoxin-like protein [Rickenella mellea]